MPLSGARLNFFQEQAFYSTVFIEFPAVPGLSKKAGTGFLVSEPKKGDTHRQRLLLISNKHVLADSCRPIKLHFHGKIVHTPEGIPVKEAALQLVELTNTIDIQYTDTTCDLACLNVSDILHSESGIGGRAFPLQMFATLGEAGLHPGQDVFFVGYPSGHYDTVNNLPLLRRGTIASFPQYNYLGRPELLIDANVFEGSSGSPVFVSFGALERILGILTRTVKLTEALEVAPGDHIPIDVRIGLGAVIKAPEVVRFAESVFERLESDGEH